MTMDTCIDNTSFPALFGVPFATKARCVPTSDNWHKVIEPGGFFGPAHIFVGNRAYCGLTLLPSGGLGADSDGKIVGIGDLPKRYPVDSSDPRCPVCRRIEDLETELQKARQIVWPVDVWPVGSEPLATASPEHLKDLREAVQDSGHHFIIEWDRESDIDNHGTDGFGVSASCVAHGVTEQIVQLNFTYYAGSASVEDLTALCQDIGNLIHERLD